MLDKIAANGAGSATNAEVQMYMDSLLKKGEYVALDLSEFTAPEQVDVYFTENRKPMPLWSGELRNAWVFWFLERLGIPVDARNAGALFNQHHYLFVTLTFVDNPDGSAPGIQRVRRAMDRYVEKVRPFCDALVFVMERGSLFGRLHVHGILRVRPHVMLGAGAVKIAAAWRSGFVRLERCSSLENAVAYCAKYMIKDIDNLSSDFWLWRR